MNPLISIIVPVYKVTEGTGTTGAWTYENLQYWTKNTVYRFAAYANGTEKIDGNVDYKAASDKLVFTDYQAGHDDLIASIPGDRTTGDDLKNMANVSFNFNHLLAKVQFVFTEQANVFLRIEGLKITNAVNKGTGEYYHNSTGVSNAYKFSNENTTNQGVLWTLSSSTSDQGYVYSTPLTPNVSVDAVDEMFVLPQDNTLKEAEFYLVTYQDAAFTNKINSTKYTIPLKTTDVIMNPGSTPVDIDGGKWCPGRVYRYHITFTADEFNEIPIKFTVNSVAAWDNNLSPNDDNDDILPGVTEGN